jgi:hypothetical protein
MRCDVLGRGFALGSPDPVLDAWLTHAFVGMAGEAAGEATHEIRPTDDGRAELLLNGEVVTGEPFARADVVDQLVTHLTSLALESGRDGLLIHAAGLVRNGRAVVVVGPSGAGKSTFTLTALGTGRWDYLTDETVRFDLTTGSVTGFGKPIGLKPQGQPRFGHLDPVAAGLPDEYVGSQWLISPVAAGAQPAREARPAALVFLQRDGGEPWLEALHPAEAAVLVAEQSSYLLELPEPLDALAALVEAVPAHRLHYGEAVEAVGVLEGLL